MISVLLADDHEVVRQGLRVLLSSESDFQVVGEAAAGLETVALTERLQPNVLLLDLMLPELNGLEVTRRLSKSAPDTRILILSMHDNEAYVLEAFRNGASGYLLKDAPVGAIIQGIREVAKGRRYLGPSLTDRAIEAYVHKAQATELNPYDTLTSREREVLQLAAEGHSNGEIAKRLFISSRTVETHRANVMRKLDLKSQTDIVRYAIRRGLIASS
jgi:DNA-binding NarL/FixJ family response regulator